MDRELRAQRESVRSQPGEQRGCIGGPPGAAAHAHSRRQAFGNIRQQLVGRASEGVATAGGMCNAELLISLAGGSHKSARPSEAASIQKAPLRDLSLERAAENRGNRG